jgi:hypothetical protein
MLAKMFEVRDRATFIPVLAVQLGSKDEAEAWLLGRLGFMPRYCQCHYVILLKLTEGAEKCVVDPGDWPEFPRTMPTAHKYIKTNFGELEPGAVIDVEFILGEKPSIKVSERLEDM